MNKPGTPGKFAAQGLVLCALLLGLAPLLQISLLRGGPGFADHGLWPVVLFTLKQAVLSTLISVTLGMAVDDVFPL